MLGARVSKLAVNRHFSSGIDCAMAGLATAVAAAPTPATLRNSRRFMVFSPGYLIGGMHPPLLGCYHGRQPPGNSNIAPGHPSTCDILASPLRQALEHGSNFRPR